MSGRPGSFQKLDHDVSSLHLSEFSSLRSEGATIKIANGANKVAFFRRCQKTAVYRKKRITIRPAKRHKAVSFTVFHRYVIENTGTGLLLHIHAAISKNVAQLIFEDIKDWSPLFFLCITFTE